MRRQPKAHRNIVYLCTDHVVWCPKYRRPVLRGAVREHREQIIREVARERRAEVLEVKVMPDHVHLLVDGDPQYGIRRPIKQMKGRSSHVLRATVPRCGPACHPCGRTATSSPRWAVRRWRSSHSPSSSSAMSNSGASGVERGSATCEGTAGRPPSGGLWPAGVRAGRSHQGGEPTPRPGAAPPRERPRRFPLEPPGSSRGEVQEETPGEERR